MRLCWYAFQGVACILSPYGAFTEKPPALPGDVYCCKKTRNKVFSVYHKTIASYRFILGVNVFFLMLSFSD